MKNNPDIAGAARYLKNGGVVAYPTETSYGLGVLATDAAAVRRLFILKGRSQRKSLSVITGSLARAKKIAKFNSLALALAKKYWPGPLTLVLPVRARARLASGVVKDGTVALRVSSHPVALALTKKLGAPIVATSANRSGAPACFSIREFKKQFPKHQNIFLLDIGALPHRVPSTMIISNKKLTILRQGKIRV
ncbi:MAG: L-threonylcarbamoyladenylate synthase [bacterium]|nr:L-threonylcarbamoyladenylate synthase [bacterium]